MLVFLYEIITYYGNEEEHEENLRMAFQVLRNHHLYTNLSKCDFYNNEIHYLGDIVSKKEISMDFEKIKAIMN